MHRKDGGDASRSGAVDPAREAGRGRDAIPGGHA
jgi:hypothetical protein